MNRIELAEVIYRTFPFARMKNPGGKRNRVVTQKQVIKMIDAYHAAIIDTLKRGGTIEMSNFGTLKRVLWQGRNGRNPWTGTPMVVSARWRVRFIASKKVTAAINAQI